MRSLLVLALAIFLVLPPALAKAESGRQAIVAAGSLSAARLIVC